MAQMDPTYKFSASPGTPLFQVSPERVNQQRSQTELLESPRASIIGHSRESSVHEKVNYFNSVSTTKIQLERKTNDAALNRAMLGREEAESAMRQFRDEGKLLKRKLEESNVREKKVSERLESVMEAFGRAKETHAHTQALWEKEIRRARKENFKQQSALVKLQEELKAARSSLKMAQADLQQENERRTKREEEAFAARYQLVDAQEELAQTQEKIKLVEQERDALRTIAKNEEVARIAAEGQLPLPISPEDDEFASPKKARKSLDPVSMSAASEEELDDLRLRLDWEQQRATRAHDRVEYLEAECRLNCCATRSSRHLETSSREPITGMVEKINEASAPKRQSSAIFIPAEGVFRSVSPLPEESPWISPAKKTIAHQISERSSYQQREITHRPIDYARTPSCEPPAPALVADVNTSLLSLLDAPQSPPQRIAEEEDEATPVQTFHTISTTTRIPLAHPPDLTPNTLPTNFDNVALSPTMSREEALRQIQERRGRARSLAQGTLTPRKQMIEGGPTRRDISAPAIRSGNIRGRSQARA